MLRHITWCIVLSAFYSPLAFTSDVSFNNFSTTTNIPANDIKQLSEIVKQCVVRTDTEHPVFNGCIDWHSAVHGHWALLWSAYVLKDKRLKESVLSRMTSSGIDMELNAIRTYDKRYGATFEMPYGRAWFLQYARDAENLHNFTGLRNMANYLYETLFEFAQSNGGDILATDYDNASWYLYQLYKWAEHINDKPTQERIANIILKRYMQPIEWPKYSKIRGFFDPKSLAALVLSTSHKDSAAFNQLLASYSDENIQPIHFPVRSAHMGGLNYSRTWGLTTLTDRRSSNKFSHAISTHRKYMLDSIELWSGNYRSYGHWVAQFGLLSYRLTYSQ